MPSLASLEPYLLLHGLLSLRVGILFALLPAPFGSVAPRRIRALLAILCAAVLTFQMPHAVQPTTDAWLSLARLAVGELFVGAVIGLTARVMLAAAEIAGSILGNSLGLQIGSSLDPSLAGDGSPTTALTSALATLIFFVLQGHHAILRALFGSVRSAAPGRVFETLRPEQAANLGSSMVAHGLRIALPVVATMMITQLGVGILGRIAPKVQLLGLSFALTICVGLLALWVSAGSVEAALITEVRSMGSDLGRRWGGF